jgi:predicted DCC family thiol-disulfide oxidoreductase YuxK
MTSNISEIPTTVFFDGVCNLCNTSIQFIIKRDKNGKMKFAPLQSEWAEQLIGKPQYDSLILYQNKKVYYRSTAALKIAKMMDGLWPLLYVFIIVPPFFRNFIYDHIAKNRYQWFGKKDECMIPTPELKNRFL